MARSVVWTHAAREDLDSALEFIARDSPAYASAFVREIRDAARSLTTLADRGRVVPEVEHGSLREIYVRSYRMIYQVSADQVTIAAVLHVRRDLRTAWRNRAK